MSCLVFGENGPILLAFSRFDEDELGLAGEILDPAVEGL